MQPQRAMAVALLLPKQWWLAFLHDHCGNISHFCGCDQGLNWDLGFGIWEHGRSGITGEGVIGDLVMCDQISNLVM